jgi:hypothetical protein
LFGYGVGYLHGARDARDADGADDDSGLSRAAMLVRRRSRGGGKAGDPVAGDVLAAAHPHSRMTEDVLNKLD